MANCNTPSITKKEGSLTLSMDRYRINLKKTKDKGDKEFYCATISQAVLMIDQIADPATTNEQELPINQKFFPIDITFEALETLMVEFIKANIPYGIYDVAYYNIFMEYYKTLCKKGIM